MAVEAEVEGRSGGLQWYMKRDKVAVEAEVEGGSGGRQQYNRLPKGNRWSAIPVALLCMIVNQNGGSRAATPKGTKFCRTQEDFR